VLPTVSIITPAYNRASLLDETILSVLSQDYPNLEYIVLDDGSTDDTLEVIKRHTPAVSCYSHRNMGETRTVNKGFEMSSGEIVGVVNSDDPLLPGAVSSAVNYLLANPDTVVVYPDWIMIDENGNKIREIITHDYDYLEMIRLHHCMPGPGTFFRRSVYEAIGGRDPAYRYVADFDFWLRAGLVGPFARLRRTLATFRHHSTSASVSARGLEMAREHLALVDAFFARDDLSDDVLKTKREAYSSAYYIAASVCGSCRRSTRLGYYAHALLSCPEKYPLKYRRRLRAIFRQLPYVTRAYRWLTGKQGR
jgi:glycosyltransferase involved in cell wall biosynthesis